MLFDGEGRACLVAEDLGVLAGDAALGPAMRRRSASLGEEISTPCKAAAWSQYVPQMWASGRPSSRGASASTSGGGCAMGAARAGGVILGMRLERSTGRPSGMNLDAMAW